MTAYNFGDSVVLPDGAGAFIDASAAIVPETFASVGLDHKIHGHQLYAIMINGRVNNDSDDTVNAVLLATAPSIAVMLGSLLAAVALTGDEVAVYNSALATCDRIVAASR